jgi:hypothetical protein
MNDKKPDVSIQIIVAIIGATAICIAAIIGLLQPIVSRWADNNFPTNTPLPPISLASETPVTIPTNVISTNAPVEVPTSISVVPTPTFSLSKYEFVSLQNVGTYESGNLGLQAGTQSLDNVDFQIGWLVTTQSQEKPNNSDKIVLDVQQISNQVSKVHFLLQAGWGLTPNKEIGTITFVFADGRRLDESLKIGYNIRDWSQVNTPLTAPNAQQAWKGVGWDGTTQGIVDMLTINVSSDYASTHIIQIEIKDNSMENLGSLNPAIHLWAVTMER